MKYGEKQNVLTERLTLRLSRELLEELHVMVGQETITQKKRVSLNDYVVSALEKAVGMQQKPMDVPVSKKKGKK